MQVTNHTDPTEAHSNPVAEIGTPQKIFTIYCRLDSLMHENGLAAMQYHGIRGGYKIN